MTDLSLVGGVGADRVDSSQSTERAVARRASADAAPASQTITRSSDRVELSEHARLMSKLASMPAVRTDVVNRVRGEIANGTYETDDKLDATVRGVLDELDLHG